MVAKGEKKKNKRKRGKKFKYDEVMNRNINGRINNLQKNESKENPFERVSQIKYARKENMNDIKNEYRKDFSNHFSGLLDKRIGENSKSLSEEEKQKLRYKAYKLVSEKKKNNSLNLKENNNTLGFTHKGVPLNKNNVNDSDISENEEDYDFDFVGELLNKAGENNKLSKKEQFEEMVEKSKKEREKKKQERRENQERISLLDDCFSSLNTLLKKRKKDFEVKNDDYYINLIKMQNSEKMAPTERLKTDEEIELAKKRKIDKMNKEKDNEDNDEEENSSNNSEKNDKNDENDEEQNLTKKERISKMIEERLKKAEKIMEKRKKNNEERIKQIKENYCKEDDESNNNEDEEDEDEEQEDNDEYEYEECEEDYQNEEDDEENEEDNDNNEEEEDDEDCDEDEYENEDEDDDCEDNDDTEEEIEKYKQIQNINNSNNSLKNIKNISNDKDKLTSSKYDKNNQINMPKKVITNIDYKSGKKR